MAKFFGDSTFPKEGKRAPLIWTIDFKDKEALLDWASSSFEDMEMESTERTKMQIDNICRYKGYYSDYVPLVGGARLLTGGSNSKNDWAYILVNHLQDLVEQKVSKLTIYKPNTAFVPATNEIKDKQDADVTKKVIDAIKYGNDLDAIRTQIVRNSIVQGESYLYFGWDDYLGEKKKSGEEMESSFDSFRGDANISLTFKKNVGDIYFEVLQPKDIFLIHAKTICDVQGVCIRRVKHVDELRAEYPDKADEIVPYETERYRFDFSSLEEVAMNDQVEVYEWWYKSSKFLPNGLHFITCHSAVLLEPQDNPHPACDTSDFGNIPLERLTDIDIEGELHGWPSQNNINGLQARYDRITARIFRSIIRYSTPKWTYPENSINEVDLVNDDSRIPYAGQVPPNLTSYPVITNDLFQVWQEIETLMEKTFGIFSISRGAPPPGTRAAAQMVFLEEQEKQRQQTFQRKVDKFTINVDRKILSIVSEKYGEDDSRLLSILGADRSWDLVNFDIEQIRKPVNVRIENASWLPDSKFARITSLNEMLKIPFLQQLMGPEQIAEAYEFGQQEKFLDAAKVAAVAAQGENENLMNGKEIAPPETYEEQFVHWKIHDKFFQHPHFKHAPKDVQERAIEHQQGHEYLMIEKSLQNPMFKQMLLTLPEFPRFIILPPGFGAPPVTSPQDGSSPASEPNPGDQSQAQPEAEQFQEPQQDSFQEPASNGGIQ